jgi:DNA-binding transcriptional ArsR family regulator
MSMNLPNINFNGGTITSQELNETYNSLKIFNNRKITAMLVILKNASTKLTPTEIENILGSDKNGFDQSTISQKLRSLRNLKLVKSNRKAKHIFYEIDAKRLKEMEYLNANVGLKTLRALRQPLRAEMVNMLAEIPAMNVTELRIAFKLDQSVASLHLGILRRAGIVFSKREGKRANYYASIPNLKNIADAISKKPVLSSEEV